MPDGVILKHEPAREWGLGVLRDEFLEPALA